MHALIINGSPRTKKLSNTDKILNKFTAGMMEAGSTFELYEVSDRKSWENMRQSFCRNENILIAIPLFVECIPGLLMEFLETLEPELKAWREAETKQVTGRETSPDAKKKRLSFILQSGFAEGVQLRCGEAYLMRLAKTLGCEYGGTLVKGNNFGIRLVEGEEQEKITVPYQAMGRIYAETGNFDSEACRKFTGPEIFPAPVRVLVGLMFKTFAKRGFKQAAKSWGCTKPLDDRPYAQ